MGTVKRADHFEGSYSNALARPGRWRERAYFRFRIFLARALAEAVVDAAGVTLALEVLSVHHVYYATISCKKSPL